jgi:hypothetical protein
LLYVFVSIKKVDEFKFNKDAGMYQCKAGHLAIRKYHDKRKNNKNPHMIYFFDIKNVNLKKSSHQ